MRTIRILIVADDPTLAPQVKKILEGCIRYELMEESDPQNAMRTACHFMPEIILMDVDLPGRRGVGIARGIWNDIRFHNTPILFVTTPASGATARPAIIERGGNQYIAKPFDPAGMMDWIESVIKPRLGARSI